MKYPKYNGKELDAINKKKFNVLKENLFWAIESTHKANLTKKEIDVLAWNCAFTVLTI
jgi:hypothetical protein